MPRNVFNSIKEFFSAVALLVGVGVLYVLLWFVALLVLAGLIFAGLAFFTDWNFPAKIGCSLVSAFITLKVLGFIIDVLDLFPESSISGKRKTKPCPECGKNLRTALAQQCMHCGADWHGQ